MVYRRKKTRFRKRKFHKHIRRTGRRRISKRTMPSKAFKTKIRMCGELHQKYFNALGAGASLPTIT